jgi:D-threonate/D-erythronate kinase
VLMATPPSDTRDAGEAAAALAERVAVWAQDNLPAAVVLTGGATAREVSHRLGTNSVRILGELAPGVPFGHFENGAWDGVTVITKAGGFGTPETLLDVVRALGVSSVG